MPHFRRIHILLCRPTIFRIFSAKLWKLHSKMRASNFDIQHWAQRMHHLASLVWLSETFSKAFFFCSLARHRARKQDFPSVTSVMFCVSVCVCCVCVSVGGELTGIIAKQIGLDAELQFFSRSFSKGFLSITVPSSAQPNFVKAAGHKSAPNFHANK